MHMQYNIFHCINMRIDKYQKTIFHKPITLLCLILQVVYVTATVPFLFLAIMFIGGLTLDGAMEGIIAFVKPDFAKLLTVQVCGV